MILKQRKVRISLLIHLLRISLKEFEGVLKGFNHGGEHLSSLLNRLGFSKALSNFRVIIDARVELKLEFLLRHLDEEISDLLGNGVSHIAQHYFEVGIDSCSDFSDKHVGASAVVLLRRSSVVQRHTVLIVLLVRVLTRLSRLLALVLLRHNRGSVIFVVAIVGEQVVLLSVDNSLNDLTSVVTLSLEHLANDVHNLRAQGWEAHEDSVNNVSAELFKLRVHILEELNSRLTEFLKLRLDQVVEHID